MRQEWENLTLEEMYQKLDRLLDAMESGDHTLEETFRLYTEGMELVQGCGEKIDKIEKELTVLEGEGGADA